MKKDFKKGSKEKNMKDKYQKPKLVKYKMIDIAVRGDVPGQMTA